jgi:hypothetical protein
MGDGMGDGKVQWFRLQLTGPSSDGELNIDEVVRMDGETALSKGGAFVATRQPDGSWDHRGAALAGELTPLP